MTALTCEPPPLRAHLLGQVRITVGDAVVPDDAWPRRSSRALLLVLLATPGHRLPRDRLLEALWPGAAPASAANALYVGLHGLRRVLEPGLRDGRASAYLEARGDAIRLRPHPGYWVDVDAFEAALGCAGTAAAPVRTAKLTEALALYAGDLLTGEPYAEWPIARRDELRRAWRQAVLDAAALDLEPSAGRVGVALPALERVIAADPYDEAAYRAMMRSLAATDQLETALGWYDRCARTLRAELGVEPAAATVALAAALRETPPAAPEPAPPTGKPARIDNLPAPPNPLVGRGRELETLEDLLWDPTIQLVTVTGAGGIGKTRLALAAARAAAESYSAGVCFVGLAPLRDPDLVVPTVLRSLGLDVGRGRPVGDALRSWLGDRELLLVLDNFEQVIDAAGSVAALVEAGAGLKVLVTSREPLHLRAEHELPLPPLALPPSGLTGTDRVRAGSATRYEAVALFVERTRAVNPAFDLTDDNVDAVAALCIRLGGLPLAIELAAARVRRLSATDVLTGPNSSLDLLVEGYRDLPPRQRTMRDAIAWSYELLELPEQALFRRLAVFAGGCTADAARQIAGAGALPSLAAPKTRLDAHAVVTSLVEKSLLLRQEMGDTRLGMLETIREFGLEQLATSGEAEAVNRWHAEYLLTLAEAAAAAFWHAVQGPQQAEWFDRIQVEHDNLRQALAWADDHDPEMMLRLAVALFSFWHERSYFGEGLSWLKRALERAQEAPMPLRAKALHGASLLIVETGDYESSVTLGEEALALYRRTGDQEGIGRSIHVLAQAAGEVGEWERAVALGEESLALARELGHTRGIIVSLRHLGAMALQQGDLDRAVAVLDQALRLAREHHDRLGIAWVQRALGIALHAQGDSQAAAKAFRESLLLSREHGGLSDLTVSILRLAWLAAAVGQPEPAARLFGAGEGLRDTVAFSLPPSERTAYERALATVRTDLGDDRFRAIWSAGRALPREQAIATALLTADALS